MNILGIDPGSARIGCGLIQKNGSELKLAKCGLIEIKETTATEKFRRLIAEIAKLLDETKPDVVAVEKIYFAKNQKTVIEVAEARGIIIASIITKKIPLLEYSPREIKLAVTGYGLTDKIGVAKMVGKILATKLGKVADDVTDALAIAITAASRLKYDLLLPPDR